MFTSLKANGTKFDLIHLISKIKLRSSRRERASTGFKKTGVKVRKADHDRQNNRFRTVNLQTNKPLSCAIKSCRVIGTNCQSDWVTGLNEVPDRLIRPVKKRLKIFFLNSKFASNPLQFIRTESTLSKNNKRWMRKYIYLNKYLWYSANFIKRNVICAICIM